jgi:hypothetical protein
MGEDPVGGGGGVKVTDLGSDHRLIEHGVEQLAHGAMVCPSCAKPVPIERPLAVGDELACGWCEGAGPARDYLVRDVFDTPANEVFLIARLG